MEKDVEYNKKMKQSKWMNMGFKRRTLDLCWTPLKANSRILLKKIL